MLGKAGIGGYVRDNRKGRKRMKTDAREDREGREMSQTVDVREDNEGRERRRCHLFWYDQSSERVLHYQIKLGDALC